MASQSHKHSVSERHRRREKGELSGWKLHKDWRVWLALLLMLVAIVTYVLTLDDTILPR
jgi:hypothetical protein